MVIILTKIYNDEIRAFEYAVGVDWHRRGDQIAWCEQTFAPGTWTFYYHHGAIYFQRHEDETWFRLRWS